MWTRINNPRWSVDNWIYGVSGAGSAGTIRGPRLAEDVSLPSVCFRFRPDGSALEAAGGTTHGFGQAISEWGQWYKANEATLKLDAPLKFSRSYLNGNTLFAYGYKNKAVEVDEAGKEIWSYVKRVFKKEFKTSKIWYYLPLTHLTTHQQTTVPFDIYLYLDRYNGLFF